MSTPAPTRDWTSPALDRPVINYKAENGIAILEMDDPPANTYTYAMMRQLDEAILRARFDDDVHVILLRGKGDKFFSAGANIGMLNAVTPGFKYFFCLHANETLLRLEHTPKLVIAALNGHTRGRRARDRSGGGPADRAQGRGQDRPSGSDPRRPPRHRRHGAPGQDGRQVPGDRAHGDGQHVLLRGSARVRDRQPGDRGEPRRVVAADHATTRASSCRRTRLRKRSAGSSAPSRAAGTSRSSPRSPSNARCSSCCSRARTRRKASPQTRRSGFRSSRRSIAVGFQLSASAGGPESFGSSVPRLMADG